MTPRIGFSTGACIEVGILDALPALRQSGVIGLEISTPPRHFDPWQPELIAAVDRELRARGLQAVSIHAPFGGLLDLAESNTHHRHAAIGAVLNAVDVIRTLGGHLVVVHPSDLVRWSHDVRARLHDCADSLRTLVENTRGTGVAIALESPLPHLIGGHPDEFAWLLQSAGPDLRVCLDTGHTALGGFWHQFLEVAGSRLSHIHANDTHGEFDDHLTPGDGSIDWPDIVRTLTAANYAGWIMLELSCPSGPPNEFYRRALAQAARIFER